MPRGKRVRIKVVLESNAWSRELGELRFTSAVSTQHSVGDNSRHGKRESGASPYRGQTGRSPRAMAGAVMQEQEPETAKVLAWYVGRSCGGF